ncbi:unnamed protein product, partial [Urochloa humidicola]
PRLLPVPPLPPSPTDASFVPPLPPPPTPPPCRPSLPTDATPASLGDGHGKPCLLLHRVDLGWAMASTSKPCLLHRVDLGRRLLLPSRGSRPSPPPLALAVGGGLHRVDLGRRLLLPSRGWRPSPPALAMAVGGLLHLPLALTGVLLLRLSCSLRRRHRHSVLRGFVRIGSVFHPSCHHAEADPRDSGL